MPRKKNKRKTYITPRKEKKKKKATSKSMPRKKESEKVANIHAQEK